MTLSEALDVLHRLGCLFLFQEFIFWVQKSVPDRIPEDFFFSCVFRRNFSQERGFGEVAGIPVFSILQEFFAGIPVGRNSCIYSGFLRNPEDSSSCQKLSGIDQQLKKALC